MSEFDTKRGSVGDLVCVYSSVPFIQGHFAEATCVYLYLFTLWFHYFLQEVINSLRVQPISDSFICRFARSLEEPTSVFFFLSAALSLSSLPLSGSCARISVCVCVWRLRKRWHVRETLERLSTGSGYS